MAYAMAVNKQQIDRRVADDGRDDGSLPEKKEGRHVGPFGLSGLNATVGNLQAVKHDASGNKATVPVGYIHTRYPRRFSAFVGKLGQCP